MAKKQREIPDLSSELRADIVEAPKVINEAPGIRIYGKVIKSIIYTMDVAVIANCNADAVFAVYPWTPNTKILEAVSTASKVPVLAGIGGGLTKGLRSATNGFFAEEGGAQGVVLNGPATDETIESVRQAIDVPIIYTVTNDQVDLLKKIDAGTSAFNVAGGKNTAQLVRWVISELADKYPNFPIIASGGKTDEQIQETIDAGAHAITFAANGITEATFKKKMADYR
ncbi:hydrolase [Lentilactobacillus kosonis]|uniref:Dihydrodipicolinate synthase n=1 Tax=Lentilactobacillus kosonis TaxID=2810561 RepID=A0A401FI56_9LACO|nr:hydrolase [Lentilactobacillus kosonis]GAY72044.1 dihydrodipicolinate synthase [Lentilactobacillus kosonis]